MTEFKKTIYALILFVSSMSAATASAQYGYDIRLIDPTVRACMDYRIPRVACSQYFMDCRMSSHPGQELRDCMNNKIGKYNFEHSRRHYN